MTILKRSKIDLRFASTRFPILFFLISLTYFSLICRSSHAEPRFVEGVYDPETASRGFTGIAGCDGTACLEMNPAFLYSEDEDVHTSISLGARFNKALFEIIDNWQQTKNIYASDRYRETLLKTWDFASRQTAKIDANIGLRVKNFAFSYSPLNFGAILFAHDPVLPYGEFYNFAASSVRAGYALRIPFGKPLFKSVTLGASVKETTATSYRFLFNQFSNQFDQSGGDSGSWVTARLGANAILDTSRTISLSAVISGIPLYKKPIRNVSTVDELDLQPAVNVELGRLWWGTIQGYYSISRTFRDESIWLKQHVGVEGSIGKFRMGIGISDALLTYGLSLALPLVKFSVATYGVEYSNLVHNVTDRVYWFKFEI